MKKSKEFLKKQFSFSIYDITLAGIFTALYIVSGMFLKIDFGIMKAGMSYIWVILMGLTLKPAISFITVIIADTLLQAVSGGFGLWMFEYAIIYPGIALFASLFKLTFKMKNQKIWWTNMFIINSIVIIGAFLIAILKNDFVKSSHNADSNFDFTQVAAKIIIWTCMAIMVVAFLILIYFARKKEKYKFYLGIYSLVSAIIVLFIWIWGPIAQVRYLIRLNGNQKNGSSYWKLYDVYLIARVLKTPVLLLVYTTIIVAVYKAHVITKQRFQTNKKW